MKGENIMKIKIVNKRKCIIRSTLIIGMLYFVICSSTTLSKTAEKYNKVLVSSGDTLWSIAKEEQLNNPYYESKDIRYIVNDIKQINNLEDGKLINNQILNIPTI